MVSPSIVPVLKELGRFPRDGATRPSEDLVSEIRAALALIFTDDISHVQSAALLTALTFTGLYHDPLVVAAAVQAMKDAANKVPLENHTEGLTDKRSRMKKGSYEGGFVDIVGTGGDGHNTFNVSTTAALLVSPFLLVCKHGNRAATSSSGSADLLLSLAKPTNIFELQPHSIPELLSKHTNFTFLFAPMYHPGMRFVAPMRKELGFPTIFNVLGPLTNPMDDIEARLLGVGKRPLGPVFIEVLRLMGCRKGMVVCGLVGEGLDEISPEGPTACWRLVSPPAGSPEGTLSTVEEFELHPSDFGLPTHPLDECKSKTPEENAQKVMEIVKGEGKEDAVLDYVLMNAAAMLVVAGAAENWVEGVDLIRQGIKEKWALRELQGFVSGSKEILAAQ